jgi:hypothetical protein
LTTPAFFVVLDSAVVAPFIEKSYAMFSSPLGTWLALLSIFAATYLTAVWANGRDGKSERCRSVCFLRATIVACAAGAAGPASGEGAN